MNVKLARHLLYYMPELWRLTQFLVLGPSLD